MSKFLSILIPHYNESVETIKPLLDSIALQQNFNLDDVEVIICDDGPDSVFIPNDFLNNYSFDIHYYREEKGGVSKMRNLAFGYSSGEYVMWCDCDDMFSSVLALYLIQRESKAPMQVMVNGVQCEVNGFDAFYSVFTEEGRIPSTNEVYFIDRQDGFQFVHGKIFKSDFLKKNDIHFFDDCTIHEDNVLNLQVSACTNNIKWCPTPFYLWKWRDNSICRKDPLYIKKTYIDLIKSSNYSLSWLVEKGKIDKAKEVLTQIVYDAYYTFCHPSWKMIETQEYREKTERFFATYFIKWEYIWNESSDQLKMAISNGIRQRTVMEGMEMETETLQQFLTRIKKYS